MKISPVLIHIHIHPYPLSTCTYNNLLPKVTNYGASIFKPKAKKSHIANNSKKVTLFNLLKSSFSGNSVLSTRSVLGRTILLVRLGKRVLIN